LETGARCQPVSSLSTLGWDWEGCLNLNFDQEVLAPGFGAVCTRDQLGILWAGNPQQNEAARATAYTLARTLVHADAFVSYPGGIVLHVEPVT
jgi:hypothetical protein